MVLSKDIVDCLYTVNEWTTDHFLKLNKTKTKILIAAPPDVLKNIEINGVFLDKECVRFVSNARNLGFWIDEEMNFRLHVNKTVSSRFYTIKELGKIKSFLPRDQLNTLATSLVISKLDYCNSLMYKINSCELDKLQMVQNAAIRLVSGRKKFDRLPLSPVYDKLHWLRVYAKESYLKYALLFTSVYGALHQRP